MNRKDKKLLFGQSLLEMVFAIGILLIVVAAILALATANVVGQKESEFQVIANNLAREGIEAVRNIRDSNWLAGEQWDQGLAPGNQAVAEFISADNLWRLEFSCDNKLLYLDSGIYSHQANGNLSVYSRCLTLKDICQAADGSEAIKDSCSSGEQKVGLKVIATIEWSERGRNRVVTLEDLLYQWK